MIVGKSGGYEKDDNLHIRLKMWRMLAKESYCQVKILLGKNQNRAVKRQLNPEKNVSYLPRKKW